MVVDIVTVEVLLVQINFLYHVQVKEEYHADAD